MFNGLWKIGQLCKDWNKNERHKIWQLGRTRLDNGLDSRPRTAWQMAVSSGRFSLQKQRQTFRKKKDRLYWVDNVWYTTNHSFRCYLSNWFPPGLFFVRISHANDHDAICSRYNYHIGAGNRQSRKRGGWNETSKHELQQLIIYLIRGEKPVCPIFILSK